MPSQFEFRIIRKDGGIRDGEIMISEMLIGNEKYIQSTFRDTTERKRMEKEKEPIHLILVDVVMPGMSGHTLTERLARFTRR